MRNSHGDPFFVFADIFSTFAGIETHDSVESCLWSADVEVTTINDVDAGAPTTVPLWPGKWQQQHQQQQCSVKQQQQQQNKQC